MDGISSAPGTTTDALTGTVTTQRSAAPTPSSSSSGSATTSGSAASDSITISPQGAQTVEYVATARAVAPLDHQTIQKLKAAIAQGSYPPPALIEGLINLVGAGVTKAVPSGEE